MRRSHVFFDLVLVVKSVLVLMSNVGLASAAIDVDNGRRNNNVGDGRRNNDSVLVGGSRHAKLFPLFSIVQFQNSGCQSNLAIAGGGTTNPNRNGTCYSSSECASKGGQAAGSCAAGFGVCCVFRLSATSGSVSANCSYIQNPGYPIGVLTGTTGATSAYSYTLMKEDNSVCSLRLDFETLVLAGTSTTAPLGACIDSMTVTVTTGTPTPAICGLNTGQHMYVDIGANSGDTATLAINLGTSSVARTWDIKVTQVKCASALSPPDGCLQYFVGTSGRFSTFNFAATNDHFIANPVESYAACIRQEAGFCCIQYALCSDTNSFTIAAPGVAILDTACSSLNYVAIPGASSTCTSSGPLVNRICGGTFDVSTKGTAGASIPVCDCSAPYVVGINTVTTSVATPARGVCLTWTMIPCS